MNVPFLCLSKGHKHKGKRREEQNFRYMYNIPNPEPSVTKPDLGNLLAKTMRGRAQKGSLKIHFSERCVSLGEGEGAIH